MITKHCIERDGERVLWRIQIDGVAALDVLTDDQTLARARNALTAAPQSTLVEEQLGTFGPYAVVISSTDESSAAIAIDGPDLDGAFRGGQSVVFYFARTDLLAALQVE